VPAQHLSSVRQQQLLSRMQTKRNARPLAFSLKQRPSVICLLRLREIRSENAKTLALNNARRDPFWPWYRSRYRYPYRYW